MTPTVSLEPAKARLEGVIWGKMPGGITDLDMIEDEGGDDEDDNAMLPPEKFRRRNIEKHLAAERERRKHMKEKLQASLLT